MFLDAVMGNIERITEAARGFACGIYKAQPAALVETPISNVLKLAWDGLCANDPIGLPPAPSRPFNGGQCVGVKYRINISYQFNGDSNTYGEDHFVWGEVQGVVVVFDGSQPGFQNHIEVLCRGNVGSFPTPGPLTWHRGFNTFRDAPQRIWISSVVRADNQPDNCGDLPMSYPPSPPPPQDGYTSQPVKIVYNDGTDFNVTFNLRPPTSSGGTTPPPICMRVVSGDDVFEVCFPPDSTPQLVDSGNNVERMLRDLQEELKEFREEYERDKSPFAPEDDPTLSPKPLDGEGGGEDDAPGIAWLVVTLTELPQSAQYGTPPLFTAGWVTFRIGEGYTEKQAINFERNVYKAPEGANGYGVTFTNKSKGVVVSYTSTQA